jgi:hypothetical protein
MRIEEGQIPECHSPALIEGERKAVGRRRHMHGRKGPLEVTSVCADLLVVHAVSPNRSAVGFTVNYRGFFSKMPSDDDSWAVSRADINRLENKFPKRVNRKFKSVEQGEKVDGPG